VLYDGAVLECNQNGDIRIPKVGGLSVGGVDVATETYGTTITDGPDTSVSQLASASTDHGIRLTTIEGVGYATTSQLSTYATASSIGTTNTNVSGIDTRVGTLENAGYVTSSGLNGYGFATQGYVATAVDILNNTNIGATATSGTTAGVTVTDKTSPATTGVDFNFTILSGAVGVTPTIAIGTVTTGEPDDDASVSASASGTTTTFDFTIPKGDTGASGSSSSTNLTLSGSGAVIDCTASDPGDMISKRYGSADRYGMGQYAGGVTQLFTATAY